MHVAVLSGITIIIMIQVREATTSDELRGVFSDADNSNLLLETGYAKALPHLDIGEKSDLLSVILAC